MKKHNNSRKKSEATSKRAKSRRPVPQDTKEVLAEPVGELRGKTRPEGGSRQHKRKRRASARGASPQCRPSDGGSGSGGPREPLLHFGTGGRNAGGGAVADDEEDFATFFQGLNAARVVVEVGTHSAWVQEIICGCGHEVLVANPRLMDGSKRRKRKNDRIDANKLARLGRVDPESLYPIQHRSREVRQDLVMLRARDALVAARTEIINTTRGLVKSMGTRLPKCSSRSFAQKGEEAVAVEMREALLPLVRLAAARTN